jgi:hypothetical protein
MSFIQKRNSDIAYWGPVSEQCELLVHYPPGRGAVRDPAYFLVTFRGRLGRRAGAARVESLEPQSEREFNRRY